MSRKRNEQPSSCGLGTALGLLVVMTACGGDSLHGLPTNSGQTGQDTCLTSLDCAGAATCQDGVCVPCPNDNCWGGGDADPGGDSVGGGDGGPGGDAWLAGDSAPGGDTRRPPLDLPMYVGGQWDTTYHLDWSDYLGPLANLGTPLDRLDQFLMGQDGLTGIGIIDDTLRDMIDRYIPDWVGDVVHILNGVVHFFQDVRMQGVMTLTHVAGAPRQLDATETWYWAYLQVIDKCPLGESDPNYPACAQLAVPLNLYVADFGEIRVEARPFSGVIDSADHLWFENREVRMEIGKFIMYVLNRLIETATKGQYPDLASALSAVVDCPAFQAAVESFLGKSPGSMPAVRSACYAGIDLASDAIADNLDAVTIDWDVMRFDQHAQAYDDDLDSSADRLGAPPAAPGIVHDGDFELLLGSDMDGTWFGTRP